MKKVLILGLAVLLITGCNEKEKNHEQVDDIPVDYVSILEREEYKNISLDNINSISVIKYTVGGDVRNEITDQSEISKIYNGLKISKVGDQTERACEDNTTIYKFNLKDGTSASIEIECDWFVIDGKHYNIVN